MPSFPEKGHQLHWDGQLQNISTWALNSVKFYEIHVHQKELHLGSWGQDLKLLPARLTQLIWVYEDSSLRSIETDSWECLLCISWHGYDSHNYFCTSRQNRRTKWSLQSIDTLRTFFPFVRLDKLVSWWPTFSRQLAQASLPSSAGVTQCSSEIWKKEKITCGHIQPSQIDPAADHIYHEATKAILVCRRGRKGAVRLAASSRSWCSAACVLPVESHPLHLVNNMFKFNRFNNLGSKTRAASQAGESSWRKGKEGRHSRRASLFPRRQSTPTSWSHWQPTSQRTKCHTMWNQHWWKVSIFLKGPFHPPAMAEGDLLFWRGEKWRRSCAVKHGWRLTHSTALLPAASSVGTHYCMDFQFHIKMM